MEKKGSKVLGKLQRENLKLCAGGAWVAWATRGLGKSKGPSNKKKVHMRIHRGKW
jgi:hypothetical protein